MPDDDNEFREQLELSPQERVSETVWQILGSPRQPGAAQPCVCSQQRGTQSMVIRALGAGRRRGCGQNFSVAASAKGCHLSASQCEAWQLLAAACCVCRGRNGYSICHSWCGGHFEQALLGIQWLEARRQRCQRTASGSGSGGVPVRPSIRGKWAAAAAAAAAACMLAGTSPEHKATSRAWPPSQRHQLRR